MINPTHPTPPFANISKSLHVGIMGGGQLGKFLFEACEKLDIQASVYLQSLEEPAAQSCPTVVVENFLEGPRSALRKWLSEITHLIFENEFIPENTIREHLNALSHPPCLVPTLDVLIRLQDKLEQKHAFLSAGFSTAAFEDITHFVKQKTKTIPEITKYLLHRFPEGFVLKWSRFGYDGKGTLVYSDHTSVQHLSHFLKEGLLKNAHIYAEEKIHFKRELAIVATQSLTSEIVFYPLVITEQEKGVCKRVLGPATAFQTSSSTQEAAEKIAAKMAKEFKLTGSFAIEFFETDKGLFINEIAPRVHNSGHYSLNAASVSQFENHIRAALSQNGLSIKPPNCDPTFVMLNLLGPEMSNPLKRFPTPEHPTQPKSELYWYEKKEIKTGRKMGHYSGGATTPEEAFQLLESFQTLEANWLKQL